MIANSEMPIGFAMELAKNPEALIGLSGLSKQEQDQIIDGARELSSREEMRNYVETLKFR